MVIASEMQLHEVQQSFQLNEAHFLFHLHWNENQEAVLLLLTKTETITNHFCKLK